MRNLCEETKIEDKPVVTYKGGYVERDSLQKLNISTISLEVHRCPKYHVLKPNICNPLTGCSFHLEESIHQHRSANRLKLSHFLVFVDYESGLYKTNIVLFFLITTLFRNKCFDDCLSIEVDLKK